MTKFIKEIRSLSQCTSFPNSTSERRFGSRRGVLKNRKQEYVRVYHSSSSLIQLQQYRLSEDYTAYCIESSLFQFFPDKYRNLNLCPIQTVAHNLFRNMSFSILTIP